MRTWLTTTIIVAIAGVALLAIPSNGPEQSNYGKKLAVAGIIVVAGLVLGGRKK